jgi:putative endonuclease
MGLKISNKVGKLGEDIAVKYLKNKGFHILERNFLRKTGEIDVICEKSGITHFVEVKSVSRITSNDRSINPEENFHRQKMLHLCRTLELYVSEGRHNNEDFQIDLITVTLNPLLKTAKVRFYENLTMDVG